jgi:hypothetical protein
VPAHPSHANPPQGIGTLELDCRDLLPPLGYRPFFRPRIVVDGREQRGRWGLNTLSLSAGPHHVEVFLGAWGAGRAASFITVYPGGTVWLEYRTPATRFASGSLGPPPQHHNGMWYLIVALSLFALMVICCGGIATSLQFSR